MSMDASHLFLFRAHCSPYRHVFLIDAFSTIAKWHTFDRTICKKSLSRSL